MHYLYAITPKIFNTFIIFKFSIRILNEQDYYRIKKQVRENKKFYTFKIDRPIAKLMSLTLYSFSSNKKIKLNTLDKKTHKLDL